VVVTFSESLRVRLLLPLTLAAALEGCLDSGTAPPAVPGVANAVIDTTGGPLFRHLVVTLDGLAGIRVDYWNAPSPRLQVTDQAATESHRIFLPRLWSAATYRYEITVIGPGDAQGKRYSGTFTTDSLPPDLASYRFAVAGAPTSPLTMLELTGNSPAWFTGFVAVDQYGQVVWYRRTSFRPEGWIRRGNGDLVLSDSVDGLTEISPDGTTIAYLPQDSARVIHHDVVVTPQNSLFFLAKDTRLVSDTSWTGEAVWEWMPEQSMAVKRWTAFDVLSPTVDRTSRSTASDWLHANSLSIGPRGNLLISLHYLDQVISLAPGFGPIEWRLGGRSSTFAIAPDARFSGQHTAAEVAPGRVLLFDNGYDRVDSARYSRAMEFRLDSNTTTAAKVWEFRPQPDIYARVVSSARRLANGNTVIAFGDPAGFIGSSGPVAVFEEAPDARVVWRLQVDGNLALMYRGTPLPSIGREVVVPYP
jgi:hypothetical protein